MRDSEECEKQARDTAEGHIDSEECKIYAAYGTFTKMMWLMTDSGEMRAYPVKYRDGAYGPDLDGPYVVLENNTRILTRCMGGKADR